ncbi:MAG: penicillin-binding protein 2 [Tepidisphaeraceae bacterium]
MDRFPAGRALLLLAVIPALMAVLLGRVAWLETKGRAPVLDKAERQQSSKSVLPARRGSIYDSTGQLLAGSMQVDSLFVDTKLLIDTYGPARSTDMERDLNKLADLAGVDGFELLQKVGDSYPDRFVEVTHDLSESAVGAIRDLDLPGVGFAPHNVRVYPMGSLAAHLLGTVGTDGKGVDGVELTAETALAGKDGSMRSYKDARRRNIGTANDDFSPPTHGKHLVLTIDANIQTLVESELAACVKQFEASGGECVVLDPKTGQIVALANYPTYNPQFVNDSTPAVRTNRALVVPYEPGSTLKPYIVTRALDQGLIHIGDVLQLDGPKWKTPYGRTITDVHGYQQLAVWDVLVKSSNIGMSQIAEKIGNPTLYAAVKSFGFGTPVGSDLPGDAASAGLLNPLIKWTRASPESIAQGYEIMVTPIQMARAMSCIANDGRLLEPTLIKGVLNDDGSLATLDGKPRVPIVTQVVKPETAQQVRRILADVPIRGTAKNARSDKYNLFGKTGTAHRAVNGHYDTEHYTASFVGGAPFESPRLVIAFVIHDPNRAKAHYGGLVAAPAASRVLERSLTYLGVPESPLLPVPPESMVAKLYEFDAKEYEKRSGVASGQ